MIIKRFWKSVKKLGEVTNEVASAMDSAFNLGYPTCCITQKCPFEHNFERYRVCHEAHEEDCPLMSIKLFIR